MVYERKIAFPSKTCSIFTEGGFPLQLFPSQCIIGSYIQEHRHNLLNYEDNEGMRPIFAAIQEGHIEVLKYLLEFEIVDINSLNKVENNSLYH